MIQYGIVTHSTNADPEIFTENWVTVEREINCENWVAADWWNRQRPLIHDWRMKSIEKTESSLTHGIASETASLLTINLQRKHSRWKPWNHNWNLSDSWRVESTARPTQQIDSKNRLMIQYGIVTLYQCWSRNCHWKLSHCRTRNHLWKLSRAWLMESTTNTNSRLTHEINRKNRVIIDAWNCQWNCIAPHHKSSAKT
jgi:hypothetical protein